MPPPTLGDLCLLTAHLTAMIPPRDHPCRATCTLMSLDLPLLIRIAQTHEALRTPGFLIAAARILRWTLHVLLSWRNGQLAR